MRSRWREGGGGGRCGFYEQMCRPAASGLNPWKYGRGGGREDMEPFSISKVSKHCGRKLKLTKTITGLPGVGLNENIFIRLNQSVIVLSCQAYLKQSICTSEKIRH